MSELQHLQFISFKFANVSVFVVVKSEVDFMQILDCSFTFKKRERDREGETIKK